MASSLEQELICPICRCLFKDPVILCCSHTFCRACLQTYWELNPSRLCAVCLRSNSYTNSPQRNLALKNVVEEFIKLKDSEPECSLHSEKLRLFCLDHWELICLVCRDSRAHKKHKFRPIQEAAPGRREQQRRNMEPLQDTLKELNESRVQFDDAEAHILAQYEDTKEKIRKQYQQMHLCLCEEEFAKMKALREEKEQKIQEVKDKMDAVTRDIETVSKTISDIEEQLRAGDASFLLQYKAAVERVQRCYLVEAPKIKRSDLINQAKYLGNLGFNAWMNMKEKVQFYPVVLDPNTAAPDLIISDNMTSLTVGQRQKVPLNRRRRLVGSFGRVKCASRTPSWDVDVSGNKSWTVGVKPKRPNERGGWNIHFCNNKYMARSRSGLRTRLSVKNLQKVRVTLDRDRKTVTFTDPDTNTHLHTFTNTCTGKLAASFSADTSLKILPKEITVAVTSDSQPVEHQGLQAVSRSVKRSDFYANVNTLLNLSPY